MHELALFAGTGGGILGGKILGWKTACAVERDAYAASILAQRQNDGFLRPFPIWSDVQTFDGRPWRGRVDIISGGFPCQDISQAGKGAGIDGAKSGLWSHMARITDEVRPPLVWVENSPLLVSRGGSRVLGDLAEMGYDAVWGIVGAGHTAAPHIRKRIWILAYSHVDTDSNSLQQHRRNRPVQMGWLGSQEEAENNVHPGGIKWPPESGLGRVAHGVAYRVDRIRATGNGQVPRVVALAWHRLTSMTN